MRRSCRHMEAHHRDEHTWYPCESVHREEATVVESARASAWMSFPSCSYIYGEQKKPRLYLTLTSNNSFGKGSEDSFKPSCQFVYSSIISFGMYISLTPAEGSLPSVVPLVLPGQCLHDSSQVQCVVADIHPHC